MAMYNYYDGRRVPNYWHNPSPSELAVPVTFLDPRRPEVYRREDHYLDDNYGRYYRLQDNSDYSRYGLMPSEQVVRREGGAGHVTPWWLGRDYPNYGEYVGAYPFPPLPWDYDPETRPYFMTVEMYVPVCCEECERKVRKHLKGIEDLLWKKVWRA